MDEIPVGEFPPQIENSIRAGLLLVDSERCNGLATKECLKKSYDIYAFQLQSAGWVLSDELLCELIPAWVFDWAVAKEWWHYPPLRPRPSGINIRKILAGKYQSSHEPVPESERNVQFGSFMVTDRYKQRFLEMLKGSKLFWQAQALIHSVPATFASEPAESDPSVPSAETCDRRCPRVISHAERVQAVNQRYGRGGGGREPYKAFYKPLDVTAQQFSAWKTQDWQHCPINKRQILDHGAQKLLTEI